MRRIITDANNEVNHNASAWITDTDITSLNPTLSGVNLGLINNNTLFASGTTNKYVSFVSNFEQGGNYWHWVNILAY